MMGRLVVPKPGLRAPSPQPNRSDDLPRPRPSQKASQRSPGPSTPHLPFAPSKAGLCWPPLPGLCLPPTPGTQHTQKQTHSLGRNMSPEPPNRFWALCSTKATNLKQWQTACTHIVQHPLLNVPMKPRQAFLFITTTMYVGSPTAWHIWLISATQNIDFLIKSH